MLKENQQEDDRRLIPLFLQIICPGVLMTRRGRTKTSATEGADSNSSDQAPGHFLLSKFSRGDVPMAGAKKRDLHPPVTVRAVGFDSHILQLNF
ncbi:MAG: hypothetical protein WBD81_18055 [Collimonas pratensis]|uniref:hypothetical protein n=1 Tax=Collimonas pratensis TaxID=279113 RepID=UPI003C739CA6